MSDNQLVVARTMECWQALRREVEGIELSAPVYLDPVWTVRDVLLHCAFWNNESVKAVEAHRDGGTYVTDTGAASFDEGLDAMNARVIEESRAVPDDDVRERWIAAQDALTEAVRSLDADEMSREIGCPWGGHLPVERMVDEELTHEQDHITDVLTAVTAQEDPG